jgi:hypothetical protein
MQINVCPCGRSSLTILRAWPDGRPRKELNAQELKMSVHDHSDHHRGEWASFLTSPPGLVLIAFLAVAGVYLWMEHQAHLLGALVWLPLLACPLMHLFMHHGHGGHGGGSSRDGESK